MFDVKFKFVQISRCLGSSLLTDSLSLKDRYVGHTFSIDNFGLRCPQPGRDFNHSYYAVQIKIIRILPPDQQPQVEGCRTVSLNSVQ